MKLIIICGPSGSGKSTLSKNILNELQDGIILNTDNYYKTGIISKIMSKITESYFDKEISFNYKLFKKDLDYILKNRASIHSYSYDFKLKFVKKNIKKIKNIKYIIVEGIFTNELLNYLSQYNILIIIMKTKKVLCKYRVVNRDILERGKKSIVAKKDFLKGWELFKKKEKFNKIKLVNKKLIINDIPDIKMIIKNIIKMKN